MTAPARLLTASGLLVDIANPDPSQIRIADIAHALSRLPRFGGHVPGYPYCVGQHCLMVSEAVPREQALVGLLHDAAEAYLGDMASPVKALVPEFSTLERRWLLAIGARFELGAALAELSPEVKDADARALATERRDLMAPNPGWTPAAEPYGLKLMALAPEFAKDAFLNRFGRLTDGRWR